jgi:hypothetical protein
MQIITRADWPKYTGEASLRRSGTPELAYTGCHARECGYGELPGIPKGRLYVKRIDRAEWPERIRDRINRRLFERTRPLLPNHDQNGHSSCWVQAPIRAVEICRYLQGLPPHLLSVESALIPIDGARDRGGNPEEAIIQLQEFGACHQRLWPPNEFRERLADPTWKTERGNHRIFRFVDLRDWEEQISFALHDLPHVIALEWWKHAVCGLDPELIGAKDVGIRIDNSWGQWGDRGTKVLDEESGTAADWGAWGCLLTSMEPLEPIYL